MSRVAETSGARDRIRHRLDNGLLLLVLPRRHLPTFAATLIVPAGTAVEPESLPGIAFFCSQMLPLGTTSRPALKLSEEIEGLGGSLSSGCDYDYASAEVTGLSRNAEPFLDILADVSLRPAFDPEEIERRRTQLLGLLARRKDDYPETVRTRFAQALYRDHPYRRIREGEPEAVARIGRDDLARFHGGRYGPDGSILAVVGDVDPDSMIRSVEERFGAWKGGDPTGEAEPESLGEGGRQVVEIQESVAQAYIRVGNLGIPRNHPDYAAVVLANYLLGGGGFGSRLMTRLREEKGLTYGAYSGFVVRRRSGHFSAVMQTGIETMNEALGEMLDVIARFVEEGGTEEELDRAKRFLTGSLPLTLETNDQIAQRLIEQEFFGLPEEFWLRELEEIRSIDSRRVLETARRHIRPGSFAIVVLADFSKQEFRITPPREE